MTEYEKMGGTYRKAGDYILPDLEIGNRQEVGEAPMEWLQKTNNIRNRAMEIVNAEVVFA